MPGGKSIEEIYAEAAELDGQTVTLRARVMKISEKIMGKNWVTLQDGSGTGSSAILLATTDAQVTPGETVVTTGVVRKDADVGSGYKYKVLLEETTFSR